MDKTRLFINNVMQKMDKVELTDDRDNIVSFNSFTGWFTFYFKFYFANMLKDKLNCDTESIADKNTEAIRRLIYSTAIRTMIFELHDWKKAIEKSNLQEGRNLSSNERYLMFCRRFRNDSSFRSFCEKYNVLIMKIRNIVEYTLALYKEAITAIVNDQNKIHEKFKVSIEDISDIELTDGDSHNNGKRAILFVFKGRKIIYKPHSLANDLFLEAVYTEFNKHIPLKLKTPKTITGDDYGWQEFIQKQECKTEEEYRNYYYRYGEMICLAYCLNMTDLHRENLISHREYPVIIDTETVIANNGYNLDKEKVAVMNCDTPQKLLNRCISKSVMNTQLLPVNVLGGIFDIDLCPLSINNAQKSKKILQYKILEEFTDNIHVDAQYYEQNVSNTKPLEHSACKYLKEILDGFTDCYICILENKTYYGKFVEKEMIRHKLILRQVLRPTYVYGKFLDASNHPDYLEDIHKQAALISKLKSLPYKNEQKMAKQADMEIAAILNGDIPYFYVKADSKALQSIYGDIEAFYSGSIKDLVAKRISLMSEDDLITQQRLLRLSMSTLLDSNWNHSERRETKTISNYTIFSSGRDKEIVQKVGDYLCHEAVWDDTRKFCIWPSQALLTPKLKVFLSGFSLYDGGGTVLFLHYLAKETKNDLYRVVADGIMQGFLYNQEYLSLSAYHGIGSLLYIYYSLYKLWKDEEYYVKYKQCLKQVEKAELTEGMRIDYINGLSGMAVLLENLYGQEGDQMLLQLAKKYIDYCLEHLDEMKLTGLAHGYSGIILAVTGYYGFCKEEKYYDEAIRIISMENKYYDSSKNNWKDLRNDVEDSDPVYWCHGAGGICLARMKACKHLKGNASKADMEKCIKKIRKDMLSLKDHSLCHGIFGNLDCLMLVAEYTDYADNGLNSIIENLYHLAIEDVKQNGVICGIANAYDMFSFMLGIPGIAYTILRKNNRKIPSILLLDFCSD